MNVIFFFTVIFTLIHSGLFSFVHRIGHGEGNRTILFQNPDDFDISILVFDRRTDTKSFKNFTFNVKIMADFNLTEEQVRSGYIEVDKDGMEDFVIGKRRHKLGVTTNTIVYFQNTGLSLNLDHFKSLTMKDIENDPSLHSDITEQPLKWRKHPGCTIRSLDVSLTTYSLNVRINDAIVTTLTLKKNNFTEKEANGPRHYINEGLLLLVLNPSTCEKTYETVMLTADFGGFRDLMWILGAILPGRLIIVASLRDGATFLTEKTRKLMERLGSFWAQFYLYLDAWLAIFTKGGKTFQELLITNNGAYNSSGSPSVSNIEFDPLLKAERDFCRQWPRTPRWEARRIFCEAYDGFDDLCSCENPFQIPKQQELEKKGKAVGTIPMVIVAGHRTRHLFHLFQSIGHQDKVVRENFLLVTDEFQEELARLAFILKLKILFHKPEGKKAMRISGTFRFTLYNALKVFPTADAFIILEDDLLLSPDFYQYMNHLFPLFEMDSSIYCVNAYNHLSYPHTSSDPTLLYRVKTIPAYGWMMSRKNIIGVLPRWMPSFVNHDWDFFLGSDFVRNNRDCIIPDINRSYHWSTMGFHLKASFFAEKLYLSRSLNSDPRIQLGPLNRLLRENYDTEYLSLLRQAIPLNSTEVEESEDIKGLLTPGKIYSLFVYMKDEYNADSMRFTGEILNVWGRDVRDAYKSSWRMFYNNAILFVIGVPSSPFRYLMPEGYRVIKGSNETSRESDLEEFILRSHISPLLHTNHYQMPLQEHFPPRRG